MRFSNAQARSFLAAALVAALLLPGMAFAVEHTAVRKVGRGLPGMTCGFLELPGTAPFPIPAGYEPILEPEFPWGYFDQPAPRR